MEKLELDKINELIRKKGIKIVQNGEELDVEETKPKNLLFEDPVDGEWFKIMSSYPYNAVSAGTDENGYSVIDKMSIDFRDALKFACIEYDGIQHYKPIKFFGGKKSFSERIKRDKIKTNFCLDNDIQLIRISYKDNMEEKLECLKMM